MFKVSRPDLICKICDWWKENCLLASSWRHVPISTGSTHGSNSLFQRRGAELLGYGDNQSKYGEL